MSPRPRGRWLALSLMALAALDTPLSAQSTLEGETASKQPPVRPPNILLLIADDLGVESVGAYDEAPYPPYTPHTPVIDQLATDGVLFRNCWANPGCSPTRATMLTGRYSFRTGIGQAINYFWSPIELSPDEIGIPERLGGHYRSGALGKWHLATLADSGKRHPDRFGFDTFRGGMKILPGYIGDAYYEWEKVVDGETSTSTTYATTDTVDDALEFIEETTEAGAPWFLWTAFHAPHAPFHKPPPQLHTYDLPPLVSDDVTLHMYAMTEALDTEIGRLLAGIDPDVLAETVIIFIGDNGAPASVTAPPLNPQHAKKTVYEGGLNVPLIVTGPEVARGQVCDALVNATDIFATIIELATGTLPKSTPDVPLDSVSLKPYFEDPAQPSLRRWVFSEFFMPNGINPYYDRRTMREDRFKLIQSVHPTNGVELEEFYDLLADPGETTNLLDLPPLPPATADILSTLRKQMEELNSSLNWHEIEGGPPGKKTAPLLAGSGTPTPGAAMGLSLTQAPPNTLGLLIAGPPQPDSRTPHGTLVPHPQHTIPVQTDAQGRLELQGVWPELTPRDSTLVFQIVFPETGGLAETRITSNTVRLSLR